MRSWTTLRNLEERSKVLHSLTDSVRPLKIVCWEISVLRAQNLSSATTVKGSASSKNDSIVLLQPRGGVRTFRMWR